MSDDGEEEPLREMLGRRLEFGALELMLTLLRNAL